MSMDAVEQMRGTFKFEALDLLIELDSALLSLEEEPGDSTLVHRVFRAIHTIKGSGAMAGYAHLAGFAHKIEEAFDLARGGLLAVTPELIDCALKACDVIRQILEENAEEAEVPGEAEVTSAFTRLLPAAEDLLTEPRPESKTPARIRAAFEIVLRPKREMFYSGSDPVTLLDDLRELGQAHITVHTNQVPLLASLDPEHCYLWWEILLVTDRDQDAIREVFVFVEDDCEFSIQLRKDQADAVDLLSSVPPEMFDLFLAESGDHLDAIERDALALERDPASRHELDSIFRSVHSLKGNSALLLEQVQDSTHNATHPLQTAFRMTHALESLLDSFRGVFAGPVPQETIHTTLETCDGLRNLLRSLSHSAGGQPASPQLLERLGLRTKDAPSRQTVDAREAAFLNTVSQCAEMISGCLLRMEDQSEPAGPNLQTYLRGLKTWSAAAQYRNSPELEESLAEQLRVVEAAVKTGESPDIAGRKALTSAFRASRLVLDRMLPGGELNHVPEPVSDAQSATKSSADRSGTSVPPSTIRIDQNKLDRLMRVVGELLVARGAFPLMIQKINEGADGVGVVKDLKDAGSNISRIADELQTSVMSIRMLPIKTVFQRFPRLVRDLARSLGKEVRLVIEGEAIELDKTILEQIGDPLVHVIRNAVDHGFETPEERRAMGKDPSGQLVLRAFHETGGVAIEVTDDGRGLDVDALKRKAVEKRIITPEAAVGMSEEAAIQLIFLPGLTTAAKVTDVSGRGVGMDVVHSNVRNLRGSIEIHSKVGQGTSLLIKLPTSLMISKGILLEVGTHEYILPLTNIREMVKLPREEAHEYRGHTLAQVRGRVYSLFSLAALLGLAPTDTPELSVAIVEAGAARYGLVVDRFLTEVEVLVKPLSGNLERCKEFQGAAIMGDGRVVLVLNPLECHSLDGTACN